MKQCSRCKEIKNEDNENFYFRKDMNKFYGICKICWTNGNTEVKKQYGKMIYNKNKILERIRKYNKVRRKNNVFYKLRIIISCNINNRLRNSGGSKNGNSIINFLSYSIINLKQHLESLFEPWMAWENWGKYKPYTSMKDENFKKCWALENLRLLNSKQNIIEGSRRIRHKHIK